MTQELTMGPNVFTEESEAHAPTIVRSLCQSGAQRNDTHMPLLFEQIYFDMSTGVRITNLMSYGAEDELLLTYSFANGSEDNSEIHSRVICLCFSRLIDSLVPGAVPAGKPKPSAKELNALIGKEMDKHLEIFRGWSRRGSCKFGRGRSISTSNINGETSFRPVGLRAQGNWLAYEDLTLTAIATNVRRYGWARQRTHQPKMETRIVRVAMSVRDKPATLYLFGKASATFAYLHPPRPLAVE
jgi:hypothetical protein